MRIDLPDDKAALTAAAAVAALCYLLAVYLIGVLIGLAAGSQSGFVVLAYVVVLPLCFVVYRYWAPEREDGAPSPLICIAFAAAAGLAACAVGVIIGGGRTVAPSVLTIVCLGVAAPVAEELLFRGVILGRLERSAGPVFALIASSVLFAIAHIGSGNVLAMLAPGIAGLLFGGVYLKTRSVTWSIAAHVVSNLATFAIAAFAG